MIRRERGFDFVPLARELIALIRPARVALRVVELRGIGRVTLLDSLRCVKLALWDENRRKLVSFREALAAA